MASDRLIHFVCTSREHLSNGEAGLTQYEGEWALCPELLGTGHEWFDTGGVPVRDAIAQRRELMDVEREAEPATAA